MKLALKVDVTTPRGARDGVPRLAGLLTGHDAGATFFFCVGRPRERWRRFVPASDFGRRLGSVVRDVRAAGFDTGVQATDAKAWRRHIGRATMAWTEAQMRLAIDRYADACGELPRSHAAPGWQTNAHALRLTQRLGFDFCSDGRGHGPHLPVRDAELVRCPQLPTTFPTLDELAGDPRAGAATAVKRLLERTSAGIAPGSVFTLSADRDGVARLDDVRRLVAGWKAQGIDLIALRTLYASLEPLQLPRCTVALDGSIDGAGRCMLQGDAFLADSAPAECDIVAAAAHEGDHDASR